MIEAAKKNEDDDDEKLKSVMDGGFGFATPPRLEGHEHENKISSGALTNRANAVDDCRVIVPPQVHRMLRMLNLPQHDRNNADDSEEDFEEAKKVCCDGGSPASTTDTTASLTSSIFSSLLTPTDYQQELQNGGSPNDSTSIFDDDDNDCEEYTPKNGNLKRRFTFVFSKHSSETSHSKSTVSAKSTSTRTTALLRRLIDNIESNLLGIKHVSHLEHKRLNTKSSPIIVLIIQHQKNIILIGTFIVGTLMLVTITKFHRMTQEYAPQRTTITTTLTFNSSHKKNKKKNKTTTPKDNKQVLAKLLGTDKPLSQLSWQDLHFEQEQFLAPLCSSSILHPAQISFTLVTQVSEDRLWMLTQHCHRWPGPISAAIFTDISAERIQQIITKENGAYGRCQTDQVTVTTRTKTGVQEGEYPVNALRNLALRGVRTSHLFYADVDFWSSDDLYATLHSNKVTERLSKDDKLALVIPAFQLKKQCDDYDTLREKSIRCRLYNMVNMPTTKDGIIEMVQAKNATAFDPTNKGGHGSTLYGEWYVQEVGDLHDIPCISSNRYEPYVAVRYCRHLPPYQEVFTGYGKNKMTQIMQMRHTGYVFSQVGGVFVVHYPHHHAKTRKAWSEGKRNRDDNKNNKQQLTTETMTDASNTSAIDWTQYKRGQVDKIFVEFRSWLQEAVAETARVKMCNDAVNDDQNLWI